MPKFAAILTRRANQASGVLLAFSLLTALVDFQTSLLLFLSAGLLRAVAVLPAILRGPAIPLAEPTDPAALPALQ